MRSAEVPCRSSGLKSVEVTELMRDRGGEGIVVQHLGQTSGDEDRPVRPCVGGRGGRVQRGQRKAIGCGRTDQSVERSLAAPGGGRRADAAVTPNPGSVRTRGWIDRAADRHEVRCENERDKEKASHRAVCTSRVPANEATRHAPVLKRRLRISTCSRDI